ncbi:uncharacterized protein [Amphiura filiformis]|uniref:uncharacterized protein n=1 Tax=Amphiura filiformis TaxID=82378 RepID=UPI003B2108B6
MLVNCRSLKSERKQHDFLDLVETHRPDVICGQESHVDASFSSSEVFPSGYTISRKDVHGGGVFVAITDQLVSTTEYSLDSKSETIWCKISVVGSKPMYIGSFYRPTNDRLEPLNELNESLSKLSQNGGLPNVILAGDLNCPSIDWDDHIVLPNPQYGYAVNRLLLDTVNDHGLHQHVHKPTRLDNILDLLFTTNPDLVEKVTVSPGMSDHSVVTATVNIKAKLSRKHPRKFFIFRKMNVEGIKNDAKVFQDSFLQSASENTRPASDNWVLFKSHINELLTTHVPQTVVKQRWDVPWTTQPIRRLIRKKKRVYNAYKSNKNSQTWEKFTKLRKTVQTELKHSKNDYLMGLLEDNNQENSKPSVNKKILGTCKKPYIIIHLPTRIQSTALL